MLNLLKKTLNPGSSKPSLAENVKGLIFDLDGTLCNSLSEIKAACDHALWELEKRPPFPTENYALFAGNGNRMLLARVLMAADIRARGEMAPVSTSLQLADPEKDAGRVAKAVALKLNYEEEQSVNGTSNVTAFPGAVSLLQAAASSGLKLAVLSNKTQTGVIRTVKALFDGIDFVDVIGAAEGMPLPKPEPETLLALVRKMGLTPSECAMIGDTDVDMQTAKGAGTHSVGVTWGFRPASELKANHADHVVDSFGALQTLLIKN